MINGNGSSPSDRMAGARALIRRFLLPGRPTALIHSPDRALIP